MRKTLRHRYVVRAGHATAVSLFLSVAPLFLADTEASTLTRSTAYEYDANTGQLTKEIIEPGSSDLCVVTTYGYDSYGNRNSATTRNCNGSGGYEAAAPVGVALFSTRTEQSTFATGQFATANTDPLGHVEHRTYDARFGVLSMLQDVNGHQTQWNYDSIGRVALQIRPDGTRMRSSYLFCGGYYGGTEGCPTLAVYVELNQPLAADGVSPNGPWLRQYYDSLNRVIQSETQGFDGSSVVVTTSTYDALGHKISESRPYFQGSPPQFTSYSYDSLDRITGKTNPDGSSASTSYSGLSVTSINELLESQTVVHDSRGRLVSVTDAASSAQTFGYDAFDNITTATDPAGHVVRTYYDVKGRKTQLVDPDMGTWNYSYDALGEMVKQTSARTLSTQLVYDVAGRLVERDDPEYTTKWTYDTCSNGIGLVCTESANYASGNPFVRTHSYDSLSRQTSLNINWNSSDTFTVSYDANGRVANRTYPTGLSVAYTYTQLGFPLSVANASSGLLYWRADAEDSEGNLTHATFGNNVISGASIDPQTGRLTGLTSGVNGGAGIQNLTYSYDYLGNLTGRQDGTPSLTETFQYDALNRLKSDAVSSPGAGSVSTTFLYDAIGNLTFRSDVGTYSYTGTGPHAVSQITAGSSGTSFTYDADGNMTSGNGRLIPTYTSFDMPTSISQGGASDTFSYGPQHERILRTFGGTHQTYYINAGDNQESFERDAVGGAISEERIFVGFGGAPFVMLKRSNGTGGYAAYYLLRDNVGSVSAVTDGAGAVLERLAYEPFGKRRFPSGAADSGNTLHGSNTDRGFTDHEELEDIGLVHMNGRIFDPLVGRFMSADPFIQAGENLQSYNRYSYAFNNPLTATDPSGYFSVFDFFAASLGVPGGALGIASSYAVHKVTTQYLGSHQWAYTIASIVTAAATAEYCGGCGSALLNADVTYTQTGSYRKSFKAGAITYAEELAEEGIGSEFGTSTADGRFENSLAHVALGCASAAATGGRCGAGALAAGFSTVALNYGGDWAKNIVAQSVIGGTGSEIGGGNFADGALSGAFGYLLNYCVHGGECTYHWEQNMYDYFPGYKAGTCLTNAYEGGTCTWAELLDFSSVLSGGVGEIGKLAEAAEGAKSLFLGRAMGLLREAIAGKGNFGLGAVTRSEAVRLGRAWVGEGFTVASDGRTLISADGLRQFRPPSYKPNLDMTQANFEHRFQPSGQWQGNGHLDIIK